MFDSVKFYKNFISVYTSYTSTSSVYIGLSFLYGDYSEMTVLCETQRTNLQLTRSGGSTHIHIHIAYISYSCLRKKDVNMSMIFTFLEYEYEYEYE